MNTPASDWIESAMSRQRDPGQTSAEEDETLFDMVRGLAATLWRWRGMIFGIVLFGLVATWLLLQTIPSSYIARSEVYFDFSRQTVVSDLPANAVAPSEAMLNTEMEILSSRNLMDVVVEELGLLDDPEFNPWLPRPGAPEPVVEEPLPPEEVLRQTAVSILLAKVDVRLVPNSYVFSVTVETLEPGKSADIANGIADLFIQQRTQRRVATSDDAISWLEGRTTDLRDRVRDAENRVAQQRALASPGADTSLNSTAVRIASLRERLAAVRADAQRLDSLASRLQSGSGAVTLDTGTIEALQEFDIGLAGDIEAATQRDPDRVSALLGQVQERVEAAARQARGEAAPIQSELEALLTVYSDQTAETQALRDSEREAAASLAAYEAMLERLKSRVAVGALDPFWPEATVISPAVPPAFSASPDRELIFAMAGIGSLTLASALALLLNALFPVVTSASALERSTGFPVLAQIPLPYRRGLKRLQKQLRRSASSPLTKALRTLRIAIAIETRDLAPRVLMLTSAETEEGKSATGHLLAQSFVQAGRKALLIDTASRGAGASSRAEQGPDLGAYLSGEVDPRDFIRLDPTSGVEILSAPDALREEAEDLMGAGSERAGLDRAFAGYGVIIISAPPVGTLPDARILARLADVVLVVVRRDASRPAAVAETLALLVSGGASRVATVLISRRGG